MYIICCLSIFFYFYNFHSFQDLYKHISRNGFLFNNGKYSWNCCTKYTLSILDEFRISYRKLFVYYLMHMHQNRRSLIRKRCVIDRLPCSLYIGALNERRKRDVHSIKSANISSSRGFCMSVVGFPQSQDSPKIICAIDKWYNRIIKCLSTRSNFIVRVTRLRSINIFMTYSVPLFIYGCLIIIREVRFEREGHISIIVIGILTSNILRLSFLTL